MVPGSVVTHVMAMRAKVCVLMVCLGVAATEPITEDDSTCVVLTGRPPASAKPILITAEI